MYTRTKQQAAEKELRSLSEGEGEGKGLNREEETRESERRCLEDAMRSVELKRQMEGMLEMEGGKLGFLVYRVD